MAIRVTPALAGRWQRLTDLLGEHRLDALLVTNLPSVRYLSSFTGSSGWLLFRQETAPVLFTDSRYEDQAASEVPDEVEVNLAPEGLASALGEYLSRVTSGARLGFEPEYVSVFELGQLNESAEGGTWVEVPAAVMPIRAVKDDEEIDLIREAAAVAEGALARTLEALGSEPEMTERSIAARLEFELRRGGSDALPFDVIVASGPRTSLPHAQPSERSVDEGDLLLLDFGASIGGYCCDITRTVVLGRAHAWQRDLHAAVLEAQEAAFEAIRVECPAADVDQAARERLARDDFEKFFGHSTGHGIGLEVHEDPKLSRRSSDVLAPGHVVTVEPGVYLPDRGGVRIEDDVWVREGGPELITGFTRRLLEL
jgi:Xaa-Pro aminopeptidase